MTQKNEMLGRQIDEILGHLGAALAQQGPSDDKIIMGHVRDAYEWAHKAVIVVRDVPHHHAAGTAIGEHVDTCAICGHDIRAH